MLIVCITLSACMGMDPDFKPEEGDDFEDVDQIENETGGINLQGAKVLRKPLNYNFDESVPKDDDGLDFYTSLASDITSYLFYTYGNFNSSLEARPNIFQAFYEVTNNETAGMLAAGFVQQPDDFLYFYDAIRYQIVKAEPVYSTEDETDESREIVSYNVTADTSKAWNWSLGVTVANEEIDALVYNYERDPNISLNFIDARFNEEDFSYEFFKDYYSNSLGTLYFDSSVFQQAYVNSDYIDAMTYAIYSLVLGLKPNQISVSYSGGLPKVEVAGYNAVPGDEEKTSVKLALADRKNLFHELSPYVGLTERNKEAIVDFILSDVIGESAQTRNTLVDYHYEDVVDAIVRYCGTKTEIGTSNGETGEDSTTVGDSFMASEVVDFPYTSFFSSLEGDPFTNTGAHEYQSVVFMPSKEIEISDIWLDFKYDYGKDGDEIFDPTKFLEIEVSMRWNKGDGSLVKEMKKKIKVFDGPADPGEDGTTIEFELDASVMQGGFGEPVKIGQFQCPEPLKPKEDERVITLNGFTDARRYYKVLEASTYGGYGVLDESRISGSYFEIAFNVAKTPGDNTTNYAFYTAVSQFFEPPEYADDPEWQ